MEGFLANRLGYLFRIWQLRYFWFALVRSDLKQRYKHSFLGIGWSLVRPLAMTAILCVVFGKLLDQPLHEYAPYVLLGMTVWQFFTESITLGAYSFSSGATYIRQQQVPLAIFPLRSILGSGFHSCVALGTALFVTLILAGTLSPLGLLYLIPAVVLLFLLGWFTAILTGIMYTYFPDTQNVLEVGLQILFYLTPIIYKPDSFQNRARLTALMEWNPMTSILAIVRTPILEGAPPALHHILISMLVVAVLGVLAIFALRKFERNLIFWI